MEVDSKEDRAACAQPRPTRLEQRPLPGGEKSMGGRRQVERATTSGNPVYDEVDEEPELHARTYLALASMFLLNLVQVVALQGPPAILSYIGEGLKNPAAQTWVPNSLSLVQAVLAPVISSASDIFQARKTILVGSCLISLVGAAITPGSGNIYRLIVAQTLIGVGFASVPLAYAVPSEILPRKWRPMVQASMNVAATLGAILGPLSAGALTKANLLSGWRDFYKLAHLDLPGFGILTAGLTLFLTGLNLGGGLFGWTNARVLAPLVVGIVLLVGFGIYEWWVKTGILHHDLFRGGKAAGRNFTICVCLIFIGGIMLFGFLIFYPVLTEALFEQDPLLLVLRSQPYWIASGLTTVVYGYWSTRFRTIRGPLFVGFLILTAGTIGIATVQPSGSTNAVVFAGLAGIGFGAPQVLLIAGVQLSTPHRLIATATAVTTSARAVAAAMFTAIYAGAISTRTADKIPSYVAKAALTAGLPPSSAPAFVQALASKDTAALPKIPGVTTQIIRLGVTALMQALADSLRVVPMIAAPFGAVACIACFFLGNLKKTMSYRMDAPVEELHAKAHHHRATQEA